MTNTIKAYGYEKSELMHVNVDVSPIIYMTEIIKNIDLNIKNSSNGFDIRLIPHIVLKVVTEKNEFMFEHLLSEQTNQVLPPSINNLNAILNNDYQGIKSHIKKVNFPSLSSFIEFLKLSKENKKFFGINYSVVQEQTDALINTLESYSPNESQLKINETYNINKDALIQMYYFNEKFQ